MRTLRPNPVRRCRIRHTMLRSTRPSSHVVADGKSVSFCTPAVDGPLENGKPCTTRTFVVDVIAPSAETRSPGTREVASRAKTKARPSLMWRPILLAISSAYTLAFRCVLIRSSRARSPSTSDTHRNPILNEADEMCDLGKAFHAPKPIMNSRRIQCPESTRSCFIIHPN